MFHQSVLPSAANMAQQRNNPFSRTSPGPSSGRPKSAVFSSPSPLSAVSTPASHVRTQSYASVAPAVPAAASSIPPGAGHFRHNRSDSRNSGSGTFAPSFIKTEEMRRGSDTVRGIEGENDFSGKRYVWLKDPQVAFVRGWVVEELANNRILVQCDDGTVSTLTMCACNEADGPVIATRS